MTIRTSAKNVTFTRPFCLGGLDASLPAGDYVVETDEERVEGVSFAAYKRVAVHIHLPSPTGNPALARVLALHPRELDAALLADAAADAGTSAGTSAGPSAGTEAGKS